MVAKASKKPFFFLLWMTFRRDFITQSFVVSISHVASCRSVNDDTENPSVVNIVLFAAERFP